LSNAEEFLPLSDAAARAVDGPNSRHAALIEDAFRVLIETPGGGVSVRGDTKSRTGARGRSSPSPSARTRASEVTEADVRVAIGSARAGEITRTGRGPAGRADAARWRPRRRPRRAM
jgi:phosphate starvation-inducible PhoH-like protein